MKQSRLSSKLALAYLALLRHYALVLANPPGEEPYRWSCAMPQGDGVVTQSPTLTSPISETWTGLSLKCLQLVYNPLTLWLGRLFSIPV